MKLARPIRRRHVLTGLAALLCFPPPAQAQIREHNNIFERLIGGFGHSNSWRNKSYTGKQVVDYRTSEKPATIVIDARARTL